MFRFEYGYLQCIFVFALQLFRTVHRSIFFLHTHTHFVNRVFVGKTCLALRVLVLNALFEYFLILFAVFWYEESSNTQPVEEREIRGARLFERWRRIWIWKGCHSKEAVTSKAKARSKQSSRLQAPQNRKCASKESSAAHKQSSAKKAAPRFNGCPRTISWPTSKAIQIELIQALIHHCSNNSRRD